MKISFDNNLHSSMEEGDDHARQNPYPSIHLNTQPHSPAHSTFFFMFQFYLVHKLVSSFTSPFSWPKRKQMPLIFLPQTHQNCEHQRRKEEPTKKFYTRLMLCFAKLGSVLSSSLFFMCALNLVVKGFFFMNSAPKVAFGRRQPWCSEFPMHCMLEK